MKVLTNEKETKRAIKAAVNQYEICNHTSIKRKRSRRNKIEHQRIKLRDHC